MSKKKDSCSNVSIPVQPFYQWLNEEGRSTISASHPGVSPAEIVRLATIMWDGLDTDVRGSYEAQYTAAVEAWKNRIKGKNQYEQDNQSLCTLEEDAEENYIAGLWHHDKTGRRSSLSSLGSSAPSSSSS